MTAMSLLRTTERVSRTLPGGQRDLLMGPRLRDGSSGGPLVHGQVVVHVLAVASYDLPQRGGPVALAPGGHRMQDGALPGGAVAPGETTLLDDPQQPVTLVGIHAPCLQTLAGSRQ